MIREFINRFKRPPDKTIGINYLQRWHVIERNKKANIYLHHYTGSDDPRALHDHPWWSLSILIRGELIEHNLNGKRIIPRWLPVIRSAKFAHRLELVTEDALTLFITGPVIREWGFHCPNGWRHWGVYTSSTANTSKTGLGCD